MIPRVRREKRCVHPLMVSARNAKGNAMCIPYGFRAHWLTRIFSWQSRFIAGTFLSRFITLSFSSSTVKLPDPALSAKLPDPASSARFRKDRAFSQHFSS